MDERVGARYYRAHHVVHGTKNGYSAIAFCPQLLLELFGAFGNLHLTSNSKAVMRSIAERHSIGFESKPPKELAQTFHEQNLISQEDCLILTQAIDIRNKVMHKREKVAVDFSFARQVVAVVQHLFSQLSQSAVEE